jgi:1,4-alpha-glucan branching enzyme
MQRLSANPAAYITFTLHSHLPYVVHHGTWPHGLDWLHEAAAETYIPLLRVFTELEKAGAALKANISLSPILLEQLSHPTFKEEFPKYLQQKIDAAQKDEQQFLAKGELHKASVAQFWQRFFSEAMGDFESLDRNIIAAFKHFYDIGSIEIITCGATHGYFALLGTDASIQAQVRVGVETHERFFGRRPRGIWLPECAYRPRGEWRYPVYLNGATPNKAVMMRAGIEEILDANGLEFFFVDTHMVEKRAMFSPYELLAGGRPIATEYEGGEALASFYRPYWADTPGSAQMHKVAFFTRDPKTGIQVWSGDSGYPGDPNYLEFHKKHWPGGHRYWRVTQSKADLGSKEEYDPYAALARTHDHAQHFAGLAHRVLLDTATPGDGAPPILCAPFDAELFGHWWFEGPEFLKSLALQLSHPGSQIKLTTASEYLDKFPPSGFLSLPEGSWGKNGTHEVWLNHDTEWTWNNIYPSEFAVQQIVERGLWRTNAVAERLVKQICRELLLLESSDWQFLITTGAARDYAEERFITHLEQLRTLMGIYQHFESKHRLPAGGQQTLVNIEERDSIFPTLTPQFFV